MLFRSWWSVIHGYKNPVINQAIISQVEKFSHVMLGGLTHEPARKLSEKLASWLPGDLDYCFFSDSGSVAVEVALKMALQYYMNRGDERRTMILALEHAYHGDTFKTMEAGDDEDYHFVLKAYGASPYVVHIPTEITALEQAFETYHDRLGRTGTGIQRGSRRAASPDRKSTRLNSSHRLESRMPSSA